MNAANDAIRTSVLHIVPKWKRFAEIVWLMLQFQAFGAKKLIRRVSGLVLVSVIFWYFIQMAFGNDYAIFETNV